MKIRTLWSDAKWIEGSLDRVKETIFEGALLTILIVFLFLHSWRSTVITGLTLPISAIATFIALHFFGFSLNFMTLMALSLCIGLLIDDAIVVRENIVRHSNMGKSHRDAALQGTQEIGVAVMATTFAILAVFIPVAFMSGVIGRFFLQFGITVAVAVLVSLFVSFTLDPMLSSIWPDPTRRPLPPRAVARPHHGARGDASSKRAHVVYDRAAQLDAERAALCAASSARACCCSASPRLTFFGSFMIVPLIGTEFVPQQDEGMVSMRLNTPIGSSLRIHRRQDPRRRGGDPRDQGRRRDRHDRRHRRRQELRAPDRRARRSQDQQAPAADRVREPDPRAPGAHGRAHGLDQPEQSAGRRSRCSAPTAASSPSCRRS